MKTMIKLMALYVVLLLFLSQMAFDLYSSYFSENIKFTVKLPSEVEPLPLMIEYRSDGCRRAGISMLNDKWYSIKSLYKGIELPIPVKEDKPGYFSWNINLNPGIICGWRLNNFILWFQYKDKYRFAKNINHAYRAKVDFSFAENLSKVPDKTENVQRFSNHFFPVLSEYGIDRKTKTLSISAFRSDFNIKEQKDILYIAKIHSNMLVRRIQSEKEDTDFDYTIIYPDGSITQDKYSVDFKKLFKMLPQFAQQP